MKNIIFKVLFKKGIKGDTGDTGVSYEVPTGAVMAYDGETTPEGYEETSAPSGGGSTLITKTITANGTYDALDDGADGYSSVIVNVSSKVVNPIYNWYANEDETLIVREKISDGSFRWYFNNVYVPKNSPWLAVPSNLTRFIKNSVATLCTVSGGEQLTGYIGFHENTIRIWNVGFSSYNYGYATAIMESTDTGTTEHTWEEPTFDPING